jgi:Domain of unknown function (DUF4398)
MHHENEIESMNARKPMPEQFWSTIGFIGLGAIALILMLGGCASKPIAPTQKIQAAELAITNAEQARVADYSSTELTSAREKLVAARAAVVREDMLSAARLAEQAKVEADLATARAATLKAKAVNDEMKKSNSVIEEEMQRNTGAQK